MKEIWKLLELLNEYLSPFSWYIQYHNKNGFKRTPTKSAVEWDRMLQDEYVCSKKFWFIKWLVENDKISNDWIKPRTDLVKEITIVDYKTGDAIWWKNKYTEVEQLIMYLSIQDEPIRFLCEIIK
jgi:hypothetical protein